MKNLKIAATEFAANINKLPSNLAAFLSSYSVSEYEEMQTFFDSEAQCGFAIKGREVVSVFSLNRGNGSYLSNLIAASTASKLDCLGDHLKSLYESIGFKVVFTGAWNEEYAPVNWDYKKFGRPNYYEMVRAI